MQDEINEYFDTLLAICRAEDLPLKTRYRQLRDLLSRLCREQLKDENLQMTDLSARISFLSAKQGLTYTEQNRLHSFRLTSNKILNREAEPEENSLLRDAKTIAFLVRKIYAADIPAALYALLPQPDATYTVQSYGEKVARRMRVCYQYADDNYLYVIPTDTISDELLRVRYGVEEVNAEFNDTCRLLWKHAQLNLIDVARDENGILTPAIIVLEPDYLLDISSLSECYKDYGHHPLNYQLTKLQLRETTRHIILGNIVNLFLDEWINTKDEPVYLDCMKKAFRQYPIELAACADLRNPDEEKIFFDACRQHFDNLRQTVQDTFHHPGYHLDRNDAVLEPSYICEPLGLQGRLDYMQKDMSAFIEMKSGKADEFTIRNTITPRESNRVQMLLYQAVLEYSMGRKHQHVAPYLLYTRYPLLYPARSSWAMLRRTINLRNRIVADEYNIQAHNNIGYTTRLIGSMTADTLNHANLSGKLWDQYLQPGIDRVSNAIARLSDMERAYFYTIYNFIVKEQYTTKAGGTNNEGRAGIAALWLATLDEKREAGEILYDLTISENHASDEHKAHLILKKPEVTGQSTDDAVALPNFRMGDAVVLYQRNEATDNVTNKLVFKGNIEELSDTTIKIRLRATQHNPSILPADSLYAVEHDAMDTGFRTMFQGLSAFLYAHPERRDLLLGIREPDSDPAFDDKIASAGNDFDRVAWKAMAARDYFLLVGPPGTGKTSRALRRMVERFHEEPDAQILLLSYTNRAVDEICKALRSIEPTVDFIRVGSELSCDPAYRDCLIENILAPCNRRSEVNERIARCRIFVGTVATISSKTELFRLKHFDVAIIDEATQILEPQLLGILCGRDSENRNAVGKFILIGDHKQLPAVVVQSTEHSEVYDDTLRRIGIINLKDSLFERLYRRLKSKGSNDPTAGRVLDMLCKQGRMHPEVAHFPNINFYSGQLEAIGLPHQTEQYPIDEHTLSDSEFDRILCRRLAFLPSVAEPPASPSKVNHDEARIVARLAAAIYKKQEHFDTGKTLGIITPYRSQIAMIKREIAALGINDLNETLVDTVERFQGSERDIIIYSFCLNRPHQLQQLSNLMQEEGMLIDRKLNVALTRARKQMFITGVPALLKQSPLYANLLKWMPAD